MGNNRLRFSVSYSIGRKPQNFDNSELLRPDKELLRKLIHMGTVLLPIILVRMGPYRGRFFLAVLVLIAVISEFLRLETSLFHNIFNALFGDMLKKKEVENLTGATAYVVTALLSSFLFNWHVVITSLFFLSLGDPVASIVGRNFGKHRIWGSKSIEGSLAFLTVALVAGFMYPTLTLIVRVLGAISAAAIELIESPIDDNVLVLLGSGAIMQILLKLFS